jgi:rhomboid family GlyGly-CTERM serine protease
LTSVARPTRRPGRAWLAVAAVLAGGAVIVAASGLPAAALDWQPMLAGREPWRWWTAAWVHWSPRHLAANLGATAVVGALGVVAALPARVALAWAAAWPLTQLGLLVQPALTRYGGLSGVLHAGVAAAALTLVWRERGRRRAVGAAVAAGLLVKLIGESPWAAPLRHPTGWDFAVAPLAHATGAVAGALCTIVALAVAPSAARPASDGWHR